MNSFPRQLRARLPVRPLRLPLLGLFAVAVVFGPARAESPAGAQHSGCAKFGADYVAVAGGDGCVRIGGHVRAATTHAEAPSLLAAPAGFAAAISDGVSSVSQTFRIRPGADTALYRR
jgi:hypothetical protein